MIAKLKRGVTTNIENQKTEETTMTTTKRRRKENVHHKGSVLTKNMLKIRATIGKIKVGKSQ
jgi:hypothetical protein